MAVQKIYAGPGELILGRAGTLAGGTLLVAERENGMISYAINEQKLDFATSNLGRIGSQVGDRSGRIVFTPFDNWNSIPALFPSYLGVTTLMVGGNGGNLVIGTQPHNPQGAADIPALIWSTTTTAINVSRCAIVKNPDIHLGVGKALFGQAELSVLPATTQPPIIGPGGQLSAFHTITENGAAQPPEQFTLTDFVRERWTGSWGTVVGFGGDGGSNPVEAEDEWVISTNARYDQLKVQEQTIAWKLSSVEFMARVRPFGPQWSQIDAAVFGANNSRGLGSRFGFPGGLLGAQQDLTLTASSSGRKITLANADLVGEGFEFGGSRLSTGEIGFVTQITFNGGVPQPQLIFSV